MTKLNDDLLVQVTGGILRGGVGPSTLMTIFDKPGRTFDTFREAIGMSTRNGTPGDTYIPAQLGSDGNIIPGRFEAPRDPNAPVVPQSR